MDTNSFGLAASCLAKEAYSGQSNRSCSYFRQTQCFWLSFSSLVMTTLHKCPPKQAAALLVSSSHKRGTDDIFNDVTDEEGKQRNARKLTSLYQPQKFTAEPQRGAQHQTNHAKTHPKPPRGFAALIKDQK